MKWSTKTSSLADMQYNMQYLLVLEILNYIMKSNTYYYTYHTDFQSMYPYGEAFYVHI